MSAADLKIDKTTHVRLPSDSNPALGLAQYAIDFMGSASGRRGRSCS